MAVIWASLVILYIIALYLWFTKIISCYVEELIERTDRIVKVYWDDENIYNNEDSVIATKFWKYLYYNGEQLSPVTTLRQLRILNSTLSTRDVLYPSVMFKAYKQLTRCEKKIIRWEEEFLKIELDNFED